MDLKVKVLLDKLLEQMREGKNDEMEPDEKQKTDVKSKNPIDVWKPYIRRWKNGRPGPTAMAFLKAKARPNRYPYSDVQI